MKKNIIIATHGNLASGFKSSIEILVGNIPDLNIIAISAYLDTDEDWKDSLDEHMKKLSDKDLNIIFTDIYGGSINQEIFLEYNNLPVSIITGINLPIILEIILSTFDTTEDFTSNIDRYLDESRLQLKLVKFKENETDNFF